jgi:hypothetical protein
MHAAVPHYDAYKVTGVTGVAHTGHNHG